MGREKAHGRTNPPAVGQVIGKLRGSEVLQAKGMSVEEVMGQLEVSDATYYHEVMALPQVAKRGIRDHPLDSLFRGQGGN